MQFPVYKIFPNAHYGGSALVAAETAEQANEFIKSFQDHDAGNKQDSRGYEFVTEEGNKLDYVYASMQGILDYGIYYNG